MSTQLAIQNYRANRDAAAQRFNKLTIGKSRGRRTVDYKSRMREPVRGRGRRRRIGAEPGNQQTFRPGDHCNIDNAGPPTGMGCEDAPPCGANVIGGNTLGSAGILPGAVGQIVITAGDAGYFQPRALYFEAQAFNAAGLIDPTTLVGGQTSLPVLLIDAAVGRVSMLRRGGSSDRGLAQGGFANTKELVAVDWAEFVSTNEQNLTLFFYNPNAGITIHAFADLWGNI